MKRILFKIDLLVLVVAMFTCATGFFTFGGWLHFLSGYTNGGMSYVKLYSLGLLLFVCSFFLTLFCMFRKGRSKDGIVRTVYALLALACVSVVPVGLATSDYPLSFLQGMGMWASKHIDIDQVQKWMATTQPSQSTLTIPIQSAPSSIAMTSPDAVELLPSNEGVMAIYRDEFQYSRYVLIRSKQSTTASNYYETGAVEVKPDLVVGFVQGERP